MAVVRDMYIKAAKDTRQLARSYWLNTAFLAGYQWVFWDENKDVPRERPGDDRIRMVVNRMASNHRTIVSHLTQREMTFEVPPNGADDASYRAAYIATEALYHLAGEHQWEKKREEAVTTILKGGTGAIALDWDEEREDSVETVLSIAEFLVEPGARDPERARWWIKAQLLNPKEVQSMYDMKECPPADATNGLNPLQERLLATHLNSDNLNPLTLVLTYYERPNKMNKKGRILVEVNNQLLQEGEWNFPFDDRLNLVVGVETVVENKWYGDTIYNQARAPQVALNYAKSNLSEHLRDASVARMLVPHSAVRTMESLTDVPGNMYPYPDGLEKPAWMTPAQLPAWLQRLPDEFKQDIDDIMGVQDAFRGDAPGRIESGTGVAILVEQSSSPVTRLIKEVAGMFTRLSRMELMLHEQETGSKRFSVISSEGGPLSLEWTGKDIAGQYYANVPLDSIMPRSRAAQEAAANKLLEMGLIDNIVDYVNYSEAPNRRNVVQELAPNVAKAARENSKMAKGEAVLPAQFDDHAKHIEEHNKFRLTTTYERLTPEEQEAVDLHVQAHETLAAEAAGIMEQRSAASAALGAVPSANGDPNELPPEPGQEMLPPPPPGGIVPPDPGQMAEELMAALG